MGGYFVGMFPNFYFIEQLGFCGSSSVETGRQSPLAESRCLPSRASAVAQMIDRRYLRFPRQVASSFWLMLYVLRGTGSRVRIGYLTWETRLTEIMFSRVDLPAPDFPMMPKNSPG